ncbi:MAG: efflux RND transporter periplasmic adaptor subunit [Bryobacteraceae bacterium]
MQSHDHDAHEREAVERSPDSGAGGGPSLPHDLTRMDRRMKRLVIAVALMFLCAFGIVEAMRIASGHALARQTEASVAAPAVVEAVAVRPSASGPILTLPGETHAWYESTIYARVTGYVAKWNVDIGDHVRKGQVLAEIETPELDAQLVAAQAKLKATRADVQVREAEAEFARTTYARWREAPKGVVSDQEREDKKAEFNGAVARLAAAQAHVALDQADVDRYAAFEKFKRVTAPYDGTIIERRIDIGNLVAVGSSSGTMPLYRMTQDDPMRIWVDVPQTAAGDLMKVGVPVGVVTNQVPSRRFEGRIARTAEAVNSQARTFRVEIDVPNSSRTLVSGMYVQAVFTLPANGLLQVPAAALVFRASGPQVAVVGADSTVHLRSVSIARDDGGTVLVASGVAPGEKVVLNLNSQVTEGQKVTVSEGSDTASGAAPAPPQRL